MLAGLLYKVPSQTIFILTCLCLQFSCRRTSDNSSEDNLFHLMPSSETGITFNNKVVDNEAMNIFNYHNFYNGGGVAIGDVNNDDKPDIFFTSNQGNNKLYINKGNWKFEDITTKAGLKSNHSWHTGVTMADVNADGWLDIYVSNAGIISGDDRANELFINQRNGTFKEQAKEFGLDDKGATTHAAFFDYDHDGDLDCFVLNNSPKSVQGFGYTSELRYQRDQKDGDRLYRNDEGKFIDVSEPAQIFGGDIAFGLGVTVGDLNNDGWEDIYVSNDFFEKDYLYINQQNGTFKEVVNDAIGHMSNGSMGSDMADINNDGYLDIFTTEMLPESDYRLKTTVKFDDYDVQNARNAYDFHQQFTCNSLQLNNHDGTFSEIAQLAGVDATGWSWGALSFDFNNDGWKDIFVCNGLSKDLTDQDFLEFVSSDEARKQMSNSSSVLTKLLDKMPSVPIANYAFLNQKDLRFKNEAEQLGLGTKSFSNGAAYGDLDNDGDLDLVVNNVNLEAFVYKNNTSEKYKSHYLKVKLTGDTANRFGYGASVTIYTKDKQQLLTQMPSRGFQSSVEPVLNFGLATDSIIDSLIVTWPGNKRQTLKNVEVDKVLTLQYKEASPTPVQKKMETLPIYADVTHQFFSGSIRHRENDYIDFDAERLLPKMLSTEGPKVTVGDVNGDGLDDLFIGSATGDTAKLFMQKATGTFVLKPQPAFVADNVYECTGAEFMDADNDGDNDLVIVSGGNIAKQGSPYLAPRMYINDGNGNFRRAANVFPNVSVNASCIKVHDVDEDGKKDILIGARNVPGNYGLIPSSILLRNNGNGTFSDITNTVAPVLSSLGMITDLAFVDVDGDKKEELVAVGDWMPVTVLKYRNGKLEKMNEVAHSSGWWNCLTVADINGDGSQDLIAGNFGLNSNIKANAQHPAKLYVSDFDKNGQVECIPVYYKSDGKAYPYHLKGEMQSQVPQIKKKFLKFSDYAGKSIEQIFTKDQLNTSAVLSVEQTQTCVFINNGKGSFSMQALPLMAQLSPVFGVVVTDINNDGKKDLFLAGNFYGLKPQSGRLDASYGTTLIAEELNRFTFLAPSKSGLFIKGQARDVASIKTKDGKECIVVSRNNNNLCLFKKRI